MNLKEKENTIIIAELSANHNQKLEIALDSIRAAKRAGANGIKFQTYTPDTLTINVKNDHFLINGGLWDGQSLYELYKSAYTPWEWHEQLFKVAKEEGLVCFSTPFDRTSVDFLESFDPHAYKIASFEIQDIPLIHYVASKGRTMILSTGMAELEDIDLAVQTCYEAGNRNIILLKCTSSYPAPIEEANLLNLKDLKQRYNVEVGLSDHTHGFIAPVVAVTLGARLIEKHFIMDKSIGGPDVSFSLDEIEFREMVQSVRETEMALGKEGYELTPGVKNNRKFCRSLFVVQDIKSGERFTEQNIRSIRPGFGLHPKYFNEVMGKQAQVDLERGTPLRIEHLK